MGDVYSALDRRLNRAVALKVLRTGAARDHETLARFRREARALASLDHRSFVTVFDVVDDEPDPFIVMELVEGESLEELLRRNHKIEPDRAVDIAIGIAEALLVAHEAGIVHRDLKPSNVMLARGGRIKVLDLGIASGAAWTPLTSRKVIQGTAGYISPEQARGEPLDGRSDIYSLGILLYEMLTGWPPFTGDSPVTILYKHLEQTPKEPRSINPQIPPALGALVMRSLQKSPADRFDSAKELCEALHETRQMPEDLSILDLRVTAPLYPQQETARYRPVRKRLGSVALVAVGALAMGFFAPAVFGREEPQPKKRAAKPEVQAPTGLALASKCEGFTTAAATLTWSPSNSQDIDSYVISRSTENQGYEDLSPIEDPGATAYTDDSLATGTTYHFKLRAVSGDRLSEYSEAVGIDTPVLCMW